MINKINFCGYDARRMNGFIMNSNYGNVAEEMKEIGKKENFNTYFLHRENDSFVLSTDNIPKQDKHTGCWAQDFWGIIGNKLLSFENGAQTDAVKDKFNLKADETQINIRNRLPINDYKNIMELLLSLPVVATEDGLAYMLIDAENANINFINVDDIEIEKEKNYAILKDMLDKTHICGGNYFITKNKNGDDEVLIGEAELNNFSISQMEKIFNTDKIHVIPQMDCHLDLFIRPLNNGKILIADDAMMKDTLTEGFNKVQNAVIKLKQENKLDDIEKLRTPFVQLGVYSQQIDNVIDANKMAKIDETEKVLNDAGYETIRIPARLYDVYPSKNPNNKSGVFLKQTHNYINANAFMNKNDELVYITNNSKLDEELGITPEIEKLIDFSIKKDFIKHLKPYVNEDKIYFVSGSNNVLGKEILNEYQGGIHCMCTEVPENT